MFYLDNGKREDKNDMCLKTHQVLLVTGSILGRPLQKTHVGLNVGSGCFDGVFEGLTSLS